jgi:hypothetical protein
MGGWAGEDSYDYNVVDTSTSDYSGPSGITDSNSGAQQQIDYVAQQAAKNTGVQEDAAASDQGNLGSGNKSANYRQSEIASLDKLSSETYGPPAPDAATPTKSNPTDGRPFDASNLISGAIKAATQGVSNYLSLPSLSSFSNFASGGGAGGINILTQGPATSVGASFGTSIVGSTNSGGSSSGKQTTGSPNILHNYNNVTYRLSIWAVPKETVNLIYDGAVSPGGGSAILNGGECIIADSGINQGDRSPDFNVDMGINNLEIETAVGNGGSSRNTDVISLKFDIIEPYTANLMARLRKLCDRINPGGGWNTLFFVFAIDWYGYTDNGVPIKIQRSKYIPFQFIDMKFKITGAGAVYSCEAFPVSSLASTVLDNTIPFHVEMKGGTIQELFASGVAQYSSGDSARQADTANTAQNKQPSNQTAIKNLTSALNNAEQEKCKPENKGQTKPTVYQFEFDSAIANATISDPQHFKELSLGMTTGKDGQGITAGKAGNLTVDIKNNVFRAQSGTKITDLINGVISVSSYMTDQYSPDGSNSGKPINLWKVYPTVKMGEIDPATRYYQRTIKFKVIPYAVKGRDQPFFGSQTPEKNEVVKTYNYIFTGQNQDVLDVDLEYQMAFVEMRNGVPTQYVKDANDHPGADIPPDGGASTGADNGYFKPRKHYTQGLANRQNSGSTTESYASISVQNLMESLLDNDADTVSIKLTIVGDPDWISQDYTLYGPNVGTSPVLSDNSVNFTKEQYIDFFFQSPNTDYDESTGVFESASGYTDFSGRYRVISVTSRFSGGKFTQELETARLRNQTPPSLGNARTDTATNKPTQTPPGFRSGATDSGSVVAPAKNTTGDVKSTGAQGLNEDGAPSFAFGA